MCKAYRIIYCLLLIIILLAVTVEDASAGWYNAGWQYRQSITIDSAQVPGILANFPVLVSVTKANLRVMPAGNVGKPNGGDIVFTDIAGIVKYNHEIERYNSLTGELAAWVQVPNVSSGADTSMYMYYGNPGAADQWNVSGTWDNNFKAVWHLAEDPSTSADGDCGGGTKEVCDSTLNSNDGDSSGMTAGNQMAGQIDGSLDFDAVDDYVQIADNSDMWLLGGGTLSAWIKFAPALVGARGDILDKEIPGGIGYSLSKRNDETITLVIGPAGPWQALSSTITLSPDTWYHVVSTFDNSSREIYINGVNRGSGSSVLPANSSALDLFIGQKTNGFGKFDGIIDEVRISSNTRSLNWIRTSFNNQSDPSSFLTFGPQQAFFPAPAMTVWGLMVFMVLAGLGAAYYLPRKAGIRRQ